MSDLEQLGGLKQDDFQFLAKLLVGLALKLLRQFDLDNPFFFTCDIDPDETREGAIIRNISFQEDKVLFFELLYNNQEEELLVLCKSIVKKYMWIARYVPTKTDIENQRFKETLKVSRNQTPVSEEFRSLCNKVFAESIEIQKNIIGDSENLFSVNESSKHSLFRRVMLAHMRRSKLYMLRTIYSPKWNEDKTVWFRGAIESGIEEAERKFKIVEREYKECV